MPRGRWGAASHGQLAPGFAFAIWDAEHPSRWCEPGAVRSGIALFKENCNDAVASYASLWQGRDDSAEAPNALRLFQTIARAERFAPQEMPGDIALLGFACDEGSGVTRAYRGSDGPATLRRALASHQGHDRCVDMGTISVDGEQKPRIRRCARRWPTVSGRVNARWSGGGHETASATALGYWMPSRRKSGHY